jgi:hypothetical protein
MLRHLHTTAVAGVVMLVSLLRFPLANAQKDTPPKESPPDVPDAIQVSAGEEVVLYAHATGWQVYACKKDPDGKFAWTLKAPEADLHDRGDKVIGKHSAGPTWKLKDGSEVKGKMTAKVDSLDPDSIPWLRVEVVEHSGKGLLSDVNIIQRVRTQGGQPPADGCDAAHPDAESRSRYSADYYFYAPAK